MSQNTGHVTPPSSALASTTSRPALQGLSWAGRGKGRGETGSSVSRPRGHCMLEVQGCPCLEPRQPAPPRPRLSLPPLTWLHSHPRGSPLARAQATCSWLSPALCCHLRTSVPRVLWVLYPPISAITHSGRDRVQFGVLPAVHPEHVLFF